LESTVGDHAAARRCFNRALDASHEINVPAIVAWATMEERLGQITDARAIYERALSRFAPGSKDKMSLWRSYELMEQRIGDAEAAKAVYQRSMRETLFATKASTAEQGDTTDGVSPSPSKTISTTARRQDEERSITMEKTGKPHLSTSANHKRNLKKEVEVVRWESSGGEVWMNDRAIETKVPFDMKKRGIAKTKRNNDTDSAAPR
jgi:tetratricopeptide (TPR) repeat protein